VVSQLALTGFYPALLFRPQGSGPLPVLVAAHGAGGLAEHHCNYWWRLLGGSHLIVCLRGQPLFRADPARGFYFPDHIELGRELSALILAMENLGVSLQPGWTFAGYSQGATMGALALGEAVGPFRRLVLIEGGYQSFSFVGVTRMAEQGLARVVLVCGGRSCVSGSLGTASLLEKAGVEVRRVVAEGAGHTYLNGVEEAVARELPWLLR
jgi:predicted esterase